MGTVKSRPLAESVFHWAICGATARLQDDACNDPAGDPAEDCRLSLEGVILRTGGPERNDPAYAELAHGGHDQRDGALQSVILLERRPRAQRGEHHIHAGHGFADGFGVACVPLNDCDLLPQGEVLRVSQENGHMVSSRQGCPGQPQPCSAARAKDGYSHTFTHSLHDHTSSRGEAVC